MGTVEPEAGGEPRGAVPPNGELSTGSLITLRSSGAWFMGCAIGVTGVAFKGAVRTGVSAVAGAAGVGTGKLNVGAILGSGSGVTGGALACGGAPAAVGRLWGTLG